MSTPATSSSDAAALLLTPLNALHLELGARMVPFAGYSMPVQSPAGLMAEHHPTRRAAGRFGMQRYGLLLNDDGGIIDDLMFVRREDHFFVVVNGACKVNDIAHIQRCIGHRCTVRPLPERALLALQGPLAVNALSRLAPGVEKMVFMRGGNFVVHTGSRQIEVFATRSGYTGEDGFEISVHNNDAEALARALLAQPEVKPVGLGARNSLRLEAGLCLYGNDIDTSTTPVEASLLWAMQKVRRAGGARAGGFPGAEKILGALAAVGSAQAAGSRKRVGLVALERVPVREHTELQNAQGQRIGEVTSGLLGPSVDKPIAIAYVRADCAAIGTQVQAIVRGKPVPMEVAAMPFQPTRYYRG